MSDQTVELGLAAVSWASEALAVEALAGTVPTDEPMTSAGEDEMAVMAVRRMPSAPSAEGAGPTTALTASSVSAVVNFC